VLLGTLVSARRMQVYTKGLETLADVMKSAVGKDLSAALLATYMVDYAYPRYSALFEIRHRHEGAREHPR
jgi:hypothetical protein